MTAKFLIVAAMMLASKIANSAPLLSKQEIDSVRSARLAIASSLSTEPGRTDLVVSALGETQTIIGSFNIGLSAERVADEFRVAEAVSAFIEENETLFTDSDSGEWARLITRESHMSSDGMRTFEYTQETDGMPWLSSGVVVRIRRDGSLESISGDIRRSIYNIPLTIRTEREIIDALELYGDDFLLTRGIEPTTMSVSWDYFGPHAHARIDEETLTVYQSQIGGDEVVRRTCIIRTSEWHIDGNGRMNDVDSFNIFNTVDHAIPCEGDRYGFHLTAHSSCAMTSTTRRSHR